MNAVVNRLDGPGGARGLDAEDALEADCGYGGRIDGVDTYKFRYITADSKARWELVLSEGQIRDIADGLLIEVDGIPFEMVRTSRAMPVGYPLLMWGQATRDALSVRSEAELETALDLLHDSSIESPRFVRLWSAAEDQLVAAMWGDRNALYVVESHEGYSTSMGDSTLLESFYVADPEGHTLTVPLADCVSWDYARRAMLRFMEHGDLGDVPTEGRIPSSLLMMGEVDRSSAMAARGAVPVDLAETSLATVPSDTAQVRVEEIETTASMLAAMDGSDTNDVPTGQHKLAMPLGPLELASWARRVVEGLQSRGLIDLAPTVNLDDLTYQLAGVLEEYDSAMARSAERGEWLARKIGLLRGVSAMFASAEQLETLLRRSRRDD